MLTLSNVLSLSRAGFALAFLQDNVLLRVFAILLAMMTDFLDGFIARRTSATSQLGAVLDSVMDKFFVFFAAGILFFEETLQAWEFTAFLARDLAICIFGFYLLVQRAWKNYECQGFFWGKVMTVVQFLVLLGLTVHIHFSAYVYVCFYLLGALSLFELVSRFKKKSS